MDPAVLARRLGEIRARRAGSDAERRAALLCARELRGAGRRPQVQTLWFRPRRLGPHVIHAALGVAGSVTAVSSPVTGLALAGAGLVLALLDALGLPLLGMLLPRRATQNVLAPPVDTPPGSVRLVLSASADVPAEGVVGSRWRRVDSPLLPGAPGLLAIALAAVAACAGARLAGVEGTGIGAVQLVPTVVLIVLAALFADSAAARTPDSAPGTGPAVALATAVALDARPPRRLAPEVLISGAGESGAPGMRSYVAARRRDVRPEDVVVIHLAARPGPVRYLVREGEHFGVRLHPQLVRLAGTIPGALPAESRTTSPARVARGARWPAIVLEGEPRELARAVLRLVAAIDAELARAS